MLPQVRSAWSAALEHPESIARESSKPADLTGPSVWMFKTNRSRQPSHPLYPKTILMCE